MRERRDGELVWVTNGLVNRGRDVTYLQVGNGKYLFSGIAARAEYK